ncbi:MAG: hypothetical protein ABIQ17_00765 [Candidatus Limnocylindrales bacterium]
MADATSASDVLPLRSAPAGLPDPDLNPPIVAESSDPFTALRVTHLVARLPRGVPVSLAAIAGRLNSTYLDWIFSDRVVADALLQLAANWAADYRSTGGVILEEGAAGATLTIEDSSRVDPWIVRQTQRSAVECRELLLDFSRRERTTGAD